MALATETSAAATQICMESSPIAGKPLYKGFREFSYELGPKSRNARSSFHRGMTLTYAFNHDEAVRWFKRAAKQAEDEEEDCVICWWGVAYALGPNINKPLDSTDRPCDDALSKVKMQIEDAEDTDRALIEALDARYQCSTTRTIDDKLYIKKMSEIYTSDPDNNDIATLYADALMNKDPWRWWPTSTSEDEILTAIDVLETVLRRKKEHIGANHMYIHAVEGSPEPSRGLESAAILEKKAQGLGHLLHMPSHIYAHLDEHEKVIRLNQEAIEADQTFLSYSTSPNSTYRGYCSHNLHFLAYGAAMKRRCNEASRAAKGLRNFVLPDAATGVPIPVQQRRAAAVWFVLARCARWAELRDDLNTHRLDENKYYLEKRYYLKAMAHFFSGLEYAAKAQVEEVSKEADAVAALAEKLAELDANQLKHRKHPVYEIQAAEQGRIAYALLRAEEARLRRDDGKLTYYRDHALSALKLLKYREPPVWLFPVGRVHRVSEAQHGGAMD